MSKEANVAGQQPTPKDYSDPPPAPLFESGELRLWSFYRAVIAEFVATLLFLYITVATIIGQKKQTDPCGGVGTLGIAFAVGGTIFVVVYCTAGISGSLSTISLNFLSIVLCTFSRRLSLDFLSLHAPSAVSLDILSLHSPSSLSLSLHFPRLFQFSLSTFYPVIPLS